MIDIEKIKGKYVDFIDKNQARRLSKVVNVHGNTITTQSANGEKERIHPTTNKIYGIYLRTTNNKIISDEIRFKQERMGKHLKNKERAREIKKEEIKPLGNKRIKRRR